MMHYGSPGSSPADRALATRYNAHEGPNEHEVDHTAAGGRPASDRPNFASPEYSSHFSTATKPKMAVPLNDQSYDHSPLNLTENTPLLSQGNVDPIPEEDTNGMTMFWEELRILTRYTWPVFGTHLLEYSLVIASVVSIGHLSTTALAAITLGSMTASVSGFSIIQGFASSLDTLLPSAWTSSTPQLVGLWSQRMVIVMAFSLIPILTIWFNSEAILILLRQEKDVAYLAALYLKWVSLGLPAYTFNCISRRYFQSQGLFSIPTRIIIVVAPINAFLSYILVWGPDWIRLGFIGAPIATAISFNLVSLASIVYGVLFVPHTAWHPINKRAFEIRGLSVLVRLGLAGVGQTASEWWSWELVGLAASLLGPVSLATQSVLLVSASTTYQAPFALAVAASVRIGNLLGSKNAARARIASNTSIVMALVLSGVWSTLFLVFRQSWGRIFNDDPEVLALVASILPLVALFQVFDGVSAVTGGILRARGRQFTGALLNLSAYYVLGIPFGIWLAFSHHLGLHGLWVGLTVALVFSAGMGTWLCLRTDWQKEVRKATERLRDGADAGKDGIRDLDVERGRLR